MVHPRRGRGAAVQGLGAGGAAWGTNRFLWFYSGWVLWAFLTPLVAWLLRRFPVERYGLLRVGVVHVLACTSLVFFQEGLLALLSRVIGPFSMRKLTYGAAAWDLVTRSAFLDTMVYVMSAGVLLAIDLRRRLRAQELTGARLQAELAKAELDALRVQLHPHFLFNTLNAISMLVRKGEGDTAVRMIAGLSDLLRLALATAGQQEVPLRQELDFLERYLSLQQIRFPDRLQIQMRIDPDTLEARVPSLVLQPLAENAVRHGIAPSIAGGSVEVAAVREGAAGPPRARHGRGAEPRLRVPRRRRSAQRACAPPAPVPRSTPLPGVEPFGGRRRVAAGNSFPWSGGGACLSQ